MMTESQQIEFNKLKDNVAVINDTVNKTHDKTDSIYYALVGNDLSKDGGLVKQIKDMKDQQEKFETEIEKRIKKLEDTFTHWKGIAFGLFFSGGIFGFLLKELLTIYFKH